MLICFPGSTRAPGSPGAGQECLFPMVQLYHGQGAAQAAVEGGDVRSWVWVNYNELTASSLEIIVSKGNHPQMALIQVSELW